MKLLIVYASYTGTTEECARRLAERLSALSPTVVSLKEAIPDVSEYDTVILGSAIRFSRLHPAARRFLKEKGAALATRDVGVFLCCAFAHDFDRYYETLIPRAVRERCFAHLNFGGTLRNDQQNFWERLLVRSMRSYLIESDIEDGEYTPTLPSLLPENVEVMASYVRERIGREAEERQ